MLSTVWSARWLSHDAPSRKRPIERYLNSAIGQHRESRMALQKDWRCVTSLPPKAQSHKKVGPRSVASRKGKEHSPMRKGDNRSRSRWTSLAYLSCKTYSDHTPCIASLLRSLLLPAMTLCTRAGWLIWWSSATPQRAWSYVQ